MAVEGVPVIRGEFPPHKMMIWFIPCVMGVSNGRAHKTETRLNYRWASATRLPAALVMIAAILAVAVVPRLSPRIRAMAFSREIAPELQRTIARAVVALEDWRIMVMMVPARKKSRGLQKP